MIEGRMSNAALIRALEDEMICISISQPSARTEKHRLSDIVQKLVETSFRKEYTAYGSLR
jgi:hypothetical protein